MTALHLFLSFLLSTSALANPRLGILEAVQQCARKAHPTQQESCIAVERDLVVLKNRGASAHTLTIPLPPVAGAESVEHNLAAGGRYLAVAWAMREYYGPIRQHLGAGRVVAIGINSALNRSQDQLHVHTTCVLGDFLERIRRDAASIVTKPAWKHFIADMKSPYKPEVYMHRFRYFREPFRGQNLFAEIYRLARAEGSDVRQHAFAVIPGQAIGAPGFILVDIVGRRGAGGHTSVILNDCGGGLKGT